MSVAPDVSTLQQRIAQLEAENQTLRTRLEDAEQTLTAIHEGQVDALVINTPEGERVFSLQGAERPYRALIEQMQEGAVTLIQDGTIHFCNRAFADMLQQPLENVTGSRVEQYIHAPERPAFVTMFQQCHGGSARGESQLCAADGSIIPVHVGLTLVDVGGQESICMVATNLSERKRAENILASAQFMRRLIENAPMGIAVVDRDRRYVLANAVYQAIANDQQITGRTIAEVFPPEVARIVAPSVQQVFDRGQHVEFREYEAPVHGRSWWNVDEIPLRDAAGHIDAVLILTQNVTERKLAADVLRESEERFRSVLENSRDCIYRVNVQTGCFEYISPAVETMVGFTAEELMAQDAATGWAMIHPDDLPIYQAAVATLAVAGQAEAEYRQRGKDGEYRWLSNHMSLAWDSQCRPLYRHGNIRDITARRHAEDALRESEERFRTLFMSVSEGFYLAEILYDEAGQPCDYRYLDVNPAFELMLDLPREQIIGKRYKEIVVPEQAAEWLETFVQVAQTGRAAGVSFYSAVYRRHFEVVAFRPMAGQFAVLVTDITARKQAEEALRLSESRERQRAVELATLLEAVPTPVIIVHDADGQHMTANRAAEQLLRIGRGAEVSLSAPAAIKPQHFRPVKDGRELTLTELPAQRAARGEAVHGFEFSLVFADGTVRDLIADGTPLLDEQGCPRGAVHTLVDITERKHAEEEHRRLLVESQERAAMLDATISSMATGLIIYDTAGKALRTSNVVQDLLPVKLFFDKTATERQQVLRWEKEDGQPFVPEEIPLMRALRGETTQNVVMATSFPDHKLWISASAAPIRTADGKTLGAVASFIDITQRKQTEESLRASERLYRGIGESINYGIWICDAQGRNTYASESFLKLTGMTQAQCSAFGWSDVLHPDDVQATIDAWKQCVQTGGPWYREHRFRGADGQWHPILACGVAVRDAWGQITHWAGINLDISQLKRTEEALVAAKIAAETASKAKDNFLAVLSHELRNPLNPVVATATMLRDNAKFDADTREQLDVICRNAAMEARLIDDLLDVTRIERGKIELERRPVQLCSIIRRAIEVCLPDIKAKGLKFSFDDTGGPYAVNADAARMQQVFWNLIKNAVKFTPVGGELRVRRYRDGDGWVAVEVQDNGEGMDPVDLDRIFNAFEQTSRDITRQFGGLGLGLTISKGLVEKHGGTIQAQSAGKGKGSTFTVRLPLLSGEAKVSLAVPPKASESPAAARVLRILLVEDHADTAKVMRRLLAHKGHTVEIAPNVASALQLAAKQPFDLLLSDLGLPDGSGLDLMIALRAKGLKMPGIALSGYGQEGDIEQSRKAGFAAHMVKPVSLPLLEETIAKIVRHAD